MVGVLYKDGDPRRDSGFTIFYMGINLGGFVAPLICGFLQKEYGWHLGFAAGGIGMLIALLIFYFISMPNFKEFDEKVGLSEDWDKPKKMSYGTKWVLIVSTLAIFTALFFALAGFVKLDPISIQANDLCYTKSLCDLFYISFLF